MRPSIGLASRIISMQMILNCRSRLQPSGDAVTILSMPMSGGCSSLNRKEQTQAQSWQTVWLWLFESPGIRNNSSLVLNGNALPHLVCNVGIIENSRLLLKEQMEAMARRAFAQVYQETQLCPFLEWEALQTITLF